MTIIATKGTLDWAYPPFILASTAAALGWDVSIFFTFYGLELLKKDLRKLKVSPLGNPAMPMKMPMGPAWFKSIQLEHPQRRAVADTGLRGLRHQDDEEDDQEQAACADIGELRSLCIEAGVNLIACQMTVDLFGYKHDEFIPEVKEYVRRRDLPADGEGRRRQPVHLRPCPGDRTTSGIGTTTFEKGANDEKQD